MRGRRRRLQEPAENHERWLISYADFITLLFAFFVVMYSISTARDGSYRVLSDSIVRAFSAPLLPLGQQNPGAVPRPEARRAVTPASEGAPVMIPLRPELLRGESQSSAAERASAELNELAGAVESRVPELIDDELISVQRNESWLEIEIKAQLLFASGSRVLLAEAVPILEGFASMLREAPNRINIEGFTDNVPIRNGRFPSNWELSAARAATVVRLFEANGIAPERLSATGYGEHQPVASNDTAEGRARNRRVVLVVFSGAASGERVPGIVYESAQQLTAR